MKNIELRTEKREYVSPELVETRLDNEISLVLQSVEDPPWAPGEELVKGFTGTDTISSVMKT
ncbi:MAG: hypothetical protein RBT57_04050 [Paludibacter sp.]|jgi:hypothetical protein|nr:hypothetical protein [Paludibacter sp.]